MQNNFSGNWPTCRKKRTVLRFFSPLSRLTKDQALPCYFNDFFRQSMQVVDLQNALDLHQTVMNDTKITSINADYRADR